MAGHSLYILVRFILWLKGPLHLLSAPLCPGPHPSRARPSPGPAPAPSRFAWFAVLFQKLSVADCPLYLRLLAGPDTDVLSFVLKENETGEVEVGLGPLQLHRRSPGAPRVAQGCVLTAQHRCGRKMAGGVELG